MKPDVMTLRQLREVLDQTVEQQPETLDLPVVLGSRLPMPITVICCSVLLPGQGRSFPRVLLKEAEFEKLQDQGLSVVCIDGPQMIPEGFWGRFKEAQDKQEAGDGR